MTFVYRRPTPEAVRRLIRRHERVEAVRRAYRDPTMLYKMLREDGYGELVELVGGGLNHWPRRELPYDPRCFDDVKNRIVAFVRSIRQRGSGRLRWGDLAGLVDVVMWDVLAEDYELQPFSIAECDEMREQALADLRHSDSYHSRRQG